MYSNRNDLCNYRNVYLLLWCDHKSFSFAALLKIQNVFAIRMLSLAADSIFSTALDSPHLCNHTGHHICHISAINRSPPVVSHGYCCLLMMPEKQLILNALPQTVSIDFLLFLDTCYSLRLPLNPFSFTQGTYMLFSDIMWKTMSKAI